MNEKGLALIELLILVFLVLFLVVGIGFYGGLIKGNFWVGEVSALKAVQRIDPTMTILVDLERHVWGYSKVTVRSVDGKEQVFAIDANILQNRKAMLVEQ